MRSLLQQKVTVNAPESDGTTALQWAAHRGDRAMADLLIKAGADVSLVNRRGVSALTAACESGSDAVVSRLLDAGADPNTTKRSGASAAMLCARSGKVAALQALIARGANVKVAEPLFGQTALHWAAAAKHSAVVELLVKAGADVDAYTWEGPPLPNDTRQLATTTDGFTPLMFAVRAGDLATVKSLLTLGANERRWPATGPRPWCSRRSTVTSSWPRFSSSRVSIPTPGIPADRRCM